MVSNPSLSEKNWNKFFLTKLRKNYANEHLFYQVCILNTKRLFGFVLDFQATNLILLTFI